MSLQSLLYNAFGLKDQEFLKTEYEGENVIIHVQTKEEHLCCASCKSKDVVRKGVVERRLRTVSIGLKPVILLALIQRLLCRACSQMLQEDIKFAEETKSTSCP